jgi:1-acyl-sn-glycerol-3-phosphate acyltransferase
MRRTIFLIAIFFHYLFEMPLLLVIWIVKFFDYEKGFTWAYRHNQRTSNLLFLCAGTKFVGEGLENITKPDTALYIGNHRSMLDVAFMLRHIDKPAICMGKKSVSKWPVISWWMKAQDTVFFNRNSPREGMKAVKAAIAFLKSGKSVIIFPEGTRTKTSDMLPFKKGSVRMAQKANVPIVPMAIKGTDDVFENNGFNLKKHTVHYKIGEPINLDDVVLEEGQSYSEYIRKIIQEMYYKLD